MKKLDLVQMEMLEDGALSPGQKCFFGSVGGMIGGVLAGGAAGSVIPVLRTTAGAAWGALGGFMSGAAATC